MSTTKAKTFNFDLRVPAQARAFLTGLRLADGGLITFVILQDGSKLELCYVSDEKITQYAQQIYANVYCKVPGTHYVEEILN